MICPDINQSFSLHKFFYVLPGKTSSLGIGLKKKEFFCMQNWIYINVCPEFLSWLFLKAAYNFHSSHTEKTGALSCIVCLRGIKM